MTQEDITCIIQWFAHIEQLATDRKNANGVVMEDVEHLLNTIKVIAKDSREYVEQFCQPSLTSNLDEAARKAALVPELVGVDEEHLYEYPYLPIAEQKFKEGAEWMAGQGYTRECTVDRTPFNGPAGICMNLHEYTGFKIGDKVIVQIRKNK